MKIWRARPVSDVRGRRTAINKVRLRHNLSRVRWSVRHASWTKPGTMICLRIRGTSYAISLSGPERQVIRHDRGYRHLIALSHPHGERGSTDSHRKQALIDDGRKISLDGLSAPPSEYQHHSSCHLRLGFWRFRFAAVLVLSCSTPEPIVRLFERGYSHHDPYVMPTGCLPLLEGLSHSGLDTYRPVTLLASVRSRTHLLAHSHHGLL
ncbi:hypothetical protein SISSUDRAFT_122136 [Sistotremastrum suecicum HHB10207 ss-3]|uniref:Uncharacterized protein n=1 Tax=Sistotremastrum suecicum HHB10207 ss-3 TaxID=1314776 RepID=A0A166B1L8_9AGAM|nr:hypothetical protein SISSUDRAFT_122136 [Sistotremastrum suecicum HHB10207 ss-3]